jgi:hypothetical protein
MQRAEVQRTEPHDHAHQLETGGARGTIRLKMNDARGRVLIALQGLLAF